MAVSVTINNTTFNIPSPGENPGWGEETTSYLVEIANVINLLLGPGDILETTFNLENNIPLGSEKDVLGLSFNISEVRAAIIDYSVYRTSDTTPSGTVESGVIAMVYDSAASTWTVTQESTGDAGVTFSVTPAGQVKYTSTDIGTTNYSGVMKFRAKTISQ